MMERNEYYKIVDELKAAAELKGFRTFTYGKITDTDLNRQNIFPLFLVVPEPAAMDELITGITFSLVGMDIVDFNKEEPVSYIGNTNLVDVHQDILARMQSVIKLVDIKYDVNYTVTFSPFSDRFMNLLAGWEVGITFTIKNLDDARC